MGFVGNLGSSVEGGGREKPGQSRLLLLRSSAAEQWDMSWQHQWDIEQDVVGLQWKK